MVFCIEEARGSAGHEYRAPLRIPTLMLVLSNMKTELVSSLIVLPQAMSSYSPLVVDFD